MRQKSSTDRKGARRGEILAVARALFAEKRFEVTSIREIADAAGILSGSLYHHFGTKEDMLDELIRPFVLPLLRTYEGMAHVNTDAASRLKAMIKFALESLIQEPELHKIVVSDRKFFAKSERFRYVEEAWQGIFECWFTVLRDGVREGQFRPDLNLHLTLRLIIELLNGTIEWFRPSGRFTIHEVTSTYIELLLTGLTPRETRSLRQKRPKRESAN